MDDDNDPKKLQVRAIDANGYPVGEWVDVPGIKSIKIEPGHIEVEKIDPTTINTIRIAGVTYD